MTGRTVLACTGMQRASHSRANYIRNVFWSELSAHTDARNFTETSSSSSIVSDHSSVGAYNEMKRRRSGLCQQLRFSCAHSTHPQIREHRRTSDTFVPVQYANIRRQKLSQTNKMTRAACPRQKPRQKDATHELFGIASPVLSTRTTPGVRYKCKIMYRSPPEIRPTNQRLSRFSEAFFTFAFFIATLQQTLAPNSTLGKINQINPRKIPPKTYAQQALAE